MNFGITWPEHISISLSADIATSMIAAGACFAILWWIARTPGRTLLEERAVPLLITLGAIFTMRCVGWLQDAQSDARWFAFWPSTILPLVMGIFVEGLLRRHLPMWLKLWTVGMTVSFVLFHIPQGLDTGTLMWWWPTGLVTTMALLAWQMWQMRNAGLAAQERRLISAVVVATIMAMPLVTTDAGLWLGTINIRLGGVGALLVLRALVTPIGGEGFRDAVAGAARALLRALFISLIVWVVLDDAQLPEVSVAFDISLALLLLFDILDRLRRRRRSEMETQLLHWLAVAPADSFEAWRRSLRHAPLVADALILEGKSVAQYDASALASVFEKHGPVVTTSTLRSALAGAGEQHIEGLEQAVDVLTIHDATHAGLLSAKPLRILAANLPFVGGHDTEMQLRVILRTGQAAAANQPVIA
jgi:hypothetical protein